jgi:hypothetical protein
MARILFSDHGERIYRVSDKLRLGDIHGYNLDPWETRAMSKIAGPGFDPIPGPARLDTIRLLALRDGFRGPWPRTSPSLRRPSSTATRWHPCATSASM